MKVEGGPPVPREPTVAQRATMRYLLGVEGFSQWNKGLMPAEFTLPPAINIDSNHFFGVSARDRREIGLQYVWRYGEPKPVRSLPRYGANETESVTQNMLTDEMNQRRNIPVIDFHTHPKQPGTTNFDRAQYPSNEDLQGFLETENIMAMLVRSSERLTCVIRPLAMVAGLISPEDIDLSTIEQLNGKGAAANFKFKIAKAISPRFSFYSNEEPASPVMKYVPPMMRPPRARRS